MIGESEKGRCLESVTRTVVRDIELGNVDPLTVCQCRCQVMGERVC